MTHAGSPKPSLGVDPDLLAGGGGDLETNRRKFVGGQGAAQCRTERGSHAHDGLGQLPRPPAGTGGSYGAAQVSIGCMQAWGSKRVGVSREGAGTKHAEAGVACGLGRLRPVGGLGRVRVCAPVRVESAHMLGWPNPGRFTRIRASEGLGYVVSRISTTLMNWSAF